jgi:hypothetical protein
VVFQSTLFDGVAFDPFSFQKDGLASAEFDSQPRVKRSLPSDDQVLLHLAEFE